MGENISFPYKLKSDPVGMRPLLQSTKNCETKSKNEKRKRLMIGCINHRKPQLMITEMPHTKDKKILYWYFLQTIQPCI